MNTEALRPQLEDVISRRALQSLFQPILDLGNGRIVGYEALIRGPSDSPLHAPDALFRAASVLGCLPALDAACIRTILAAAVERRLTGLLFVNVSPASLLHPHLSAGTIQDWLGQHGLAPHQVVLELTESLPGFEYASLKETVEALRGIGLGIAMDDLGEGFSSLRLWSEIKPAYVKLDKHFVAGIHQDPHKVHFVRSIQHIAENAAAHVIAEGIELASELRLLREIGIRYGQGYLIGRPAALPAHKSSMEAIRCIEDNCVAILPDSPPRMAGQVRAEKLLIGAPAVDPATPTEAVLDLLLQQPELHAVAVVENGIPLGIIDRPAMLDRFIRIYSRELYGRRPCSAFMDADPVIVDRTTSIQELSEAVVRKGKQSFTRGFIITDAGRYLGLGSGFDLMREITELQIVAARYANPLTGLPGNVPIQEHTERLLAASAPFVIAYADLDQFKPYNDVYGFRQGDEIIRLTARLLTEFCDPQLDFVGHLGGDDFILLFQSQNWEQRCKSILERFDVERLAHFTQEHRAAGGYVSEDRRGNLQHHDLVSLSIGAVQVDPQLYQHFQQITEAATAAKRVAKRQAGSRLFVDRRRRPPGVKDASPGES
jgi:diguanylate cyclase (GGDEF)-like protein